MNMALKHFLCLVSIFVCVHCSVVIHRGGHVTDAANNNSAIVPDKYISDGHPAEVGQFPWIVRLAIAIRSNGKPYINNCAGTLIGVRHVLTAAHCLNHIIEYYHDIEIVLGEYDTGSPRVDCARGKCMTNIIMYPDKIIVHEHFGRGGMADDIALLRLEKPAPLSAYIQIIPLPPFDIDQPSNKGVSVATIGWGETERFQSSNILLSTEIRLLPKYQCIMRHPGVPVKHLCAGDKGRSICPGDSGGPLLMYYNNKFYVSGIASYINNVKCAQSNMGFYVNVFKYVKWIKQHMKA